MAKPSGDGTASRQPAGKEGASQWVAAVVALVALGLLALLLQRAEMRDIEVIKQVSVAVQGYAPPGCGTARSRAPHRRARVASAGFLPASFHWLMNLLLSPPPRPQRGEGHGDRRGAPIREQ
eukprot:scaffold3886_cov399-Prasinococcus_capsulatus_cf.AAC.36